MENKIGIEHNGTFLIESSKFLMFTNFYKCLKWTLQQMRIICFHNIFHGKYYMFYMVNILKQLQKKNFKETFYNLSWVV